MSGQEATRRLFALLEREDVVEADLVARALGRSKRKLLRDWRKRQHPETKVGRDVLLSTRLVLQTYFPHHTSTNSPAS